VKADKTSKDRLEAEPGLRPDTADVYPDAVVKIICDQECALEIKCIAEEAEDEMYERMKPCNYFSRRFICLLIFSFIMYKSLPRTESASN